MKVVIDTSFSPRMARVLDAVFSPTHNVVHVNDVSSKANTDAEICSYQKANAPSVFIAMDLDVSGQPHRIAALDEMKCHIVLLAPGWLDIKPNEQAWMFLMVMPRVFKRLEDAPNSLTLQITPGPQPHIRKLQ